MNWLRKRNFWRYNLILEITSFAAGALLLLLALAFTLLQFEKSYFERQAINANQAGMFLQNHLNDSRNSLAAFYQLADIPIASEIALLLPAFSDIYLIDSSLRISRIVKSIPNTQIFEGYSFQLGKLGEYLLSDDINHRLSPMLRGPEDGRASVYFAVGNDEQRLLGRVDLHYVEEFLNQIALFTDFPALFVTNDGFVMLTSQNSPQIPAVDLFNWSTITPRVHNSLFIDNRRWIPTQSDALDIGAYVVTLTSTESLEAQRKGLAGFVLFTLTGIFLLLIIKNITVNKRFIKPLSTFVENMRAVEKGEFSSSLISESPPYFHELEELQNHFSSMYHAIREREKSLVEISLQAQAASQAKSTFLVNMSHEIRTPLNAVLGLSQLLKSHPIDSNALQIVDKIHESSDSLLGIINDLLDLSKIEAGKLTIKNKRFSLSSVIHRLESLFGVQARSKGLNFSISNSPSDLPDMVGDEQRLQQILINLVGNAVKFTDHGFVNLQIELLPSTSVHSHSERDCTPVFFSIRDSGIGIDAKHLPNLFSPFFQVEEAANRRFGGTGLGLSICKRLVELMGGSIDVASDPLKGSIFRVMIPFQNISAIDAEYTNEAPFPKSPCLPAQSNASQRLLGFQILVVDDSATNRFLLEKALAKEGALVHIATDGAKAIEVIQSRSEPFSVILMDLQMPVMDGFAAIRYIRKELSLQYIPIIAVTAGVLGAQEEMARTTGADEVLIKPLNIEKMIQSVICHCKLTQMDTRKNSKVH